MPVDFVDLAQTCAPLVAAEILAGVVSLESRFSPHNIRINSGAPLAKQPASKAEAIEVASTLAAERQDIQLGLGGLGMEELSRLKLSISDALDPCLNLRATATLLDGYYQHAIKAGADTQKAEQTMLQSYSGRGDPFVGAIVNYDEQVRREIKKLAPVMAQLTISDNREGSIPVDTAAGDLVADTNEDLIKNQPAAVPSWDVFSSRRRSSILVFQNNQVEHSE
ncbi:type IV secretion system protein VirB1 (plasmid) [Ensifer sp. WSM1721]|uniref:transglycosylase SLT domain-containing protein n=1 Tax=Ensifer sp. WSM1721 TaxID=1041159 RepID=UPI00047C4B34|nr:transglycosylase SLT domain-containing protein [Ensifer sp. WSM1721]